MQGYKKLLIWQKSFQLSLLIYKVTDSFPSRDRYEIASQMRRAAVSIPSNIAEGYSRKTTKEYLRFTRISLGSASELETQLLIAKELRLTNQAVLTNAISLTEEVLKLLNSTITSLKKKL